MKIKLAEALLRRKELNNKVSSLHDIKDRDIFTMVFERIKATEGLDNVEAKVPKLTASQVTAEYDHYAKQLRLIDAKIQQINWTAEIEIDASVMADYNDRHEMKAPQSHSGNGDNVAGDKVQVGSRY